MIIYTIKILQHRLMYDNKNCMIKETYTITTCTTEVSHITITSESSDASKTETPARVVC